jgi:antitoxin (DNA-binding transcriptional repressor) of toxin-antitoxin stability system
MKVLKIREFDPNLLQALTEIEESGGVFVIYRNEKPVAKLIPHIENSRLTPHPVMSAIKINYDPTEVLSHDEWPEEVD